MEKEDKDTEAEDSEAEDIEDIEKEEGEEVEKPKAPAKELKEPKKEFKQVEVGVKGRFEAVCSTKGFLSFVKAVRQIRDETTLTVKADGIEVYALCEAQIGLLYQRIPPKDFESYSLKDTAEIIVGLDFAVLDAVIGRIEEDKFLLTIEDREYNIHSPSVDFNGRIIEVSNSVRLPNLEYKNGHITFNKNEVLQNVWKNALVSTEKNIVDFVYDTKAMAFISKDDTNQTFEYRPPKDLEVHLNDRVSLRLSAEYVKKVANATKGDKNIKAFISTGQPMKIISEGGFGHKEFYIAPRIDG